MGLSPRTLSQTAFNAAVNGIASSNPGASHKKPQSIRENVTTRGFSGLATPQFLDTAD